MSRPPISISQLPDTLAQRVSYLREYIDMTQRQLAQRAFVTETLIQDIESGMEIFLAPSVRMKLARALRVKPGLLEEVEKRPKLEMEEAGESHQWKNERRTKDLLEQILQEPQGEYQCPACQSELVVREFQRRDLEDNLLVTIKIECTHCLFRWTTD